MNIRGRIYYANLIYVNVEFGHKNQALAVELTWKEQERVRRVTVVEE